MNTTTSELSESLEDYLEAIWCITNEKRTVRPKDIVARLGVTNASVTGALRTLSEKEWVHYAPHDAISLTAKGEELARRIYRWHSKMKSFLSSVLLVEPSQAEEIACRMEHALSDEIIERFVRLTTFLQVCPRCGDEWIKFFEQHCEEEDNCDRCERCVYDVLERVHSRKKQMEIEQEEARQMEAEAAQAAAESSQNPTPNEAESES